MHYNPQSPGGQAATSPIFESAEEKERRLTFLRRHRAEIYGYLTACTFPFYARKNADALLVGSGILLQIADSYFALSAAHVYDEVCEALEHEVPIYIATNDPANSFLSLGDWTVYMSKPTLGKDRDKDPLDIGVMEIPEAAAQVLKKTRRFLHLDGFDLRDRPRTDTRYIVFGYPQAGSYLVEGKRQISYGPQPYITTLYQNQRGQMSSPYPDLEIVVDFVPDRTTDHDGNPASLLHPSGMSGCGIWRVFHSPAGMPVWRLEHLKLVGIEHTWNRDVHVLRGTLVGCAVGIIHGKYEGLRRVINLHFPGFFSAE